MERVAEARNVRLIAQTDLGGHGDGMHINVVEGYAYIAHMGRSRVGTSIVDVRDPSAPNIVHQVLTPEGTHSHKLQVSDGLLLVNHERNPLEPDAQTWSAGLKVFDIANPTEPKAIGFFPTSGEGVHRMTFWEPPYAYVASTEDGYSGQFLKIVNLSRPDQPVEVGRWWMLGMRAAEGEVPAWDTTRRFRLHHALVRSGRAYCGWWDGGIVILDVSDVASPKLVSHLDFGPKESSCTHTALPLPGRDLVAVTDEVQEGRVRLVDISDESNPRVTAMLPVPSGDFSERAGRFGPHNLHETKPGTLITGTELYVTYFNAGLRIFDVSHDQAPREVGHCIPVAPPGQPAIQLNDVSATSDGLIFVTDRIGGGLYIMERA